MPSRFWSSTSAFALSPGHSFGGGIFDPSVGFALYLDFKNSLYRSGNTVGPAVSILPGYAYTRSNAKGELNGSVVPVDGPTILATPAMPAPSVSNATYVSNATSVTLTKTADGASLSFGGSGGLTVGHKYRVRFTLTASERARSGCSDNTNTRYYGAGTFNVDFIWTAVVSGNIGVSFEIADATLWAANGATMKVENLIVNEQSPVVTYFGNNVPGIVPTIGYQSRGALTNSIVQSQDFTQAIWSKVNSTLTAGAIAPDGTATAQTLAPTTVSAAFIYQAQTPSAGPYTVSVFAKAGNTGIFQMCVDLDGATTDYYNFDLTNGVLGTSSGTGTPRITNVGNGWYRCSVTITAVAATNQIYFIVGAATNSTRAPNNVVANASIYLWQGQLLNGTLPDGGPIIATTTSALSLGADALADTITAPTAVDQVFFAKINLPAVVGTQYPFNLSDGTDANMIRCFQDSGNLTAQVAVATVNQYVASVAGVTAGQDTIVVIHRLGGNWRFGKIVAGVITWAGAAAAGTFPAGVTTNAPGMRRDGIAQLNGILINQGIKVGTFTTDADVIAAVTI